MRKYYTESVSSLLQKMKEEMKIVEMMDAREELRKIWSTLPDAALQRISVTFRLGRDERLEIVATSTVAYNYLRRQRPMIESGLEEFMTAHSIRELVITL